MEYDNPRAPNYLPVLVGAVLRTSGDVLEIGSDYFSTPLLHDLCGKLGRRLTTIECVGPWADRLVRLHRPPDHNFVIVPDWDSANLDRPVGIAFVGRQEPEVVARLVERLRPWAEVIVVDNSFLPHVSEQVEKFAHRLECLHVLPGVPAVVSDLKEVDRWNIYKDDEAPPPQMPLPPAELPPPKGVNPADDGWRDQFDKNQARRPSSPPVRKRKSGLVVYTSAGHSVSLEGQFKGDTAFLVLSGPSTQSLDLKRLEGRGFVTMCVNNSWSLLRPTMWTSVDDPCTFLDAGWKDPSIMKFVPYGKQPARLGTKLEDGTFRWSSKTVDGMPNIWYYKRNEHFKTDEFLWEDSVNWGNHQKVTDDLGCKGSRSVMLAAFRLLFYLGFSTINLVGCDFHMTEEKKYAFPQARDPGSIKGNNNTYKDLNIRFKALIPQLQEAGVRVFNLNPTSRLDAFPHKSYDEATLPIVERFSRISPDGWYTWHKKTGKKLKPGKNPA